MSESSISHVKAKLVHAANNDEVHQTSPDGPTSINVFNTKTDRSPEQDQTPLKQGFQSEHMEDEEVIAVSSG